MASNYDGLTRNVWPGTWSTGTNAPIVLDTEVRGTLHSITGNVSDRLTDIAGARIQEGMLVYVKNTYTSGSTTYTGDKYYTYKLLGSEVRSTITGAVPNADGNWSLFSTSGGVGYTGSAGAIGFTGSKGDTGTAGAVGFTGSKGNLGYTGSKGDTGAVGFTGSKGDIGTVGFTGSKGADGGTGATGFTGSKGDIGSVGFTGSKGTAGTAGAVGFTGSKGDLGYTGSKGDQGIQGIIGFTGSKGDLGSIGYTGSIGYSGSKGDQGVIGYSGSEGNLDVTLNSTPPVSAGLGDVWIDDATGIQYFYMNDGNSNQWVELANSGIVGFTGSTGFTGSAGTGGSSISVGNSAVTVVDTGTDGEVTIKTEGTDRWDITNSGHLLPVANSTYDIGSADRKVTHLILTSNSLKMGTNEVSIGLTSDKLTVAGSHITTSEYIANEAPGALDITKRNHFITSSINYTLQDGTYIGQELIFYKSGVTTSTYSDITVANAKVVNISTGATELKGSHIWRLDTTGGVYANTFSCVWDGAGWCLNGGTVGTQIK